MENKRTIQPHITYHYMNPTPEEEQVVRNIYKNLQEVSPPNAFLKVMITHFNGVYESQIRLTHPQQWEIVNTEDKNFLLSVQKAYREMLQKLANHKQRYSDHRAG